MVLYFDFTGVLFAAYILMWSRKGENKGREKFGEPIQES